MSAHESSNLPRTVRRFADLASAVDFISTCLEQGTPIHLLGEIQGVSQRVGRSRAVVDRFKSVFETMQGLHQQVNLRTAYGGVQFPADSADYELQGILAEQGDVAVRFTHSEEGWGIQQIDFL